VTQHASHGIMRVPRLVKHCGERRRMSSRPPGRRPPRLGDEGLDQDVVIRDHISLVKRVVARIMPMLPDSVDRDRVESAGIAGLVEAAYTFEPGRGTTFDTFAIATIRGSVMAKLGSLEWAPEATRAESRRIERTLARLEAQLGRPAEDEEIAASLGVPVGEYHQLLSDVSGVALISLSTLLHGVAGVGRAAMVPPGKSWLAGGKRLAPGGELRRALARAIGELPRTEQLVIALYYHEELMLHEMAELLGVSEPRVCQIHAQALLRLRGKVSGKLWA